MNPCSENIRPFLQIPAILGCLLAGLSGCEVRDEVIRPVVRSRLIDRSTLDAVRSPVREIECVGGYEDGRARAIADGKPLLLVFRAEWCRFSAELSQRTLRDGRLVEVSRRAVCVMLDADRDAATCRRFGVTVFPTVVVCGPDGRERFRTSGPAAADAVATAIEQVTVPVRVAAGDPGGDPPRAE